MKVKNVNRSKHPLPTFGTTLSAGIDLRANLVETVIERHEHISGEEVDILEETIWNLGAWPYWKRMNFVIMSGDPVM